MRVLVVEDDKKIASFVVKGLKQSGFAVDHSGDGESGLLLARSTPYDAAVIDIMLPKLDGLTLVQQLRKENIRTPVIILSAKATVDDRVKGLQAGGDDSQSSSETLDGVTVGDIDSATRRQLGLPANLKGALVVQVDENSASFDAGLREGDVILEINRKAVRSADDAVALSEKIKDKRILVRVWSRGGSHYLVVDEGKAR